MGSLKEVDLYEYTEMREAEAENYLQMQTAYIAYMMIGSYFSSCHCENRVREKNLFLHYSDMRQRDQMSLESQVEREFLHTFHNCLSIFEGLQCEVVFTKREDNLLVYFHTGLEEAIVSITPTGEYSMEFLYNGQSANVPAAPPREEKPATEPEVLE